MLHSYLLSAVLLASLRQSQSFSPTAPVVPARTRTTSLATTSSPDDDVGTSPPPVQQQRYPPSDGDDFSTTTTDTTTSSQTTNQDELSSTASSSSRKSFLSQAGNGMSICLASWISTSSGRSSEANWAHAEESTTRSLAKCSTSVKNPCVSTSNVRQLDLYSPPWTFTSGISSADEAMSRLKGAVKADPACDIIEQDGNTYLKVQASRSEIFGTMDELEFVINEADQVVTFRSSANTEGSDLGANKRRLEEIRKRAGVFGIMGDNIMSADSATRSEQGYGPLGQLKAFYGLQSGAGFEDVLAE